jgi:surface antigen/peptidoglycan hydrolase CwlO-like protein
MLQTGNKNMQSKKGHNKNLRRKLLSVPVLTVASLLIIGASIIPNVRADQFDEQIKQLQSQNSQNQGQLSQLQVQAGSYQDAINQLQAQINQLQAQINASQAKQASLQKQIDDGQTELDKQRKVLGSDIKAMYVDGSISTIEMLATSKNLSDFVDKEEYRTAVQSKIQDTLKKITALQNQLKEQKTQVEQLLKDQQGQQGQLDSNRAQQSQLLSFNQSQQSGYDAQIKDNQSKISGLRAQQAAENARLFGGAKVVLGSACDTDHGDTYPSPWCNSGQDSMLDSWGMYNRECVSYTAWKVSESGRHMPYWGGIGNANQWDDNARDAGIPVDGNPRSGDVAIKNSQPYGHAMYVESVNSDGTLNISQYNANLDGRFSRAYNVSRGSLVFIHF